MCDSASLVNRNRSQVEGIRGPGWARLVPADWWRSWSSAACSARWAGLPLSWPHCDGCLMSEVIFWDRKLGCGNSACPSDVDLWTMNAQWPRWQPWRKPPAAHPLCLPFVGWDAGAAVRARQGLTPSVDHREQRGYDTRIFSPVWSASRQWQLARQLTVTRRPAPPISPNTRRDRNLERRLIMPHRPWPGTHGSIRQQEPAERYLGSDFSHRWGMFETGTSSTVGRHRGADLAGGGPFRRNVRLSTCENAGPDCGLAIEFFESSSHMPFIEEPSTG